MAVSECIRRLRLSRSGMPISAVICCVPVGEWSTWLDSLHPCELEQLGRARSDKRRAEFVSGRHAAKRAICSLACSTSWLPSLLIESGVFGQPVVRAEVAAQVGVSIAHSGDFAIALAFDSGHPMGVDLEMIDIRNESTMRAQLSARETARCDEQSVSQLEMSAHLWSAKEAVGKAMRSGLTVPSCLLEVSSIQLISCGYRLEFAQLIQYAAVAVRMGDYSLAVGLPRRTRLDESDLRGDLLRELASV